MNHSTIITIIFVINVYTCMPTFIDLVQIKLHLFKIIICFAIFWYINNITEAYYVKFVELNQQLIEDASQFLFCYNVRYSTWKPLF